MKHDDMRELLALRLYGEVDETQRANIASHLEGCRDCRTFAIELERGLGVIQRDRAAFDDAWIDALKRLVALEEPVRRISPWWIAAAGFAAGLLAFWLGTLANTTRSPAAREREVAVSPYERFLGNDPPPRSDSRGELARIGEYLGH